MGEKTFLEKELERLRGEQIPKREELQESLDIPLEELPDSTEEEKTDGDRGPVIIEPLKSSSEKYESKPLYDSRPLDQ